MLAAIDFEGGLENAWDSIITWVPKLLGFLLILGIGYFVAKAIEKVIDGILERVGFDRLVERGGLRTALSRSKLEQRGYVRFAPMDDGEWLMAIAVFRPFAVSHEPVAISSTADR